MRPPDRRTILRAMLGLGSSVAAAGSLGAQQPTSGPLNIPLTAADAVAQGLPRFFPSAEFAAFIRLGDLLIPARTGSPGAIDAEAPAFLDFLLGISPPDAQRLYRDGIRELNRRAMSSAAAKPFAQLSAAEAAPLLAPVLNAPPDGEPSDPQARFLFAAKIAFYQATVNSRQWAEARASRSRGAAGMGLYWLPIEEGR